MLQVIERNGDTQVQWAENEVISGTSGYRKLTKTFTTAADVDNLVVRVLFYKASGKAWIDDFSLTTGSSNFNGCGSLYQ